VLADRPAGQGWQCRTRDGDVIETIIFDFGNVLGFFDYRLTLQRLRPHTDLTAEQMRAAAYAADLFEAYEIGRLGTAEFVSRLRQACGLRCEEAILTAAWSDIFHPNHEVCALVPRLKPRYRLLVGSNTNELHARQFRRQFADTLRHFDGLVLSHEVGARKPRAEFFAHCQRLAGCRPESCLFIDDLPANVEGARTCGLQGIVYTDFADLQRQLAAVGVAVG
jgi:putative hydrolase of the HAD superfamily